MVILVTVLLMMVKKMLLLVRDTAILVIMVLMRVIMLLLMGRQTCFVGICPWAKHHLSATALKHFKAQLQSSVKLGAFCSP